MLLSDIVNLTEAKGNKENIDLVKTPAPGDTGEFVTTSQAARILGVTASRVRQFIMDGKLTNVKSPAKGRRDNFLRRSDVMKFKASKTSTPGRVPEENKKED